MSGTVQVENKMGVEPVGRLLIKMSLPMMFSMLVQACYNIVDSIFVARIAEDALTAVSLAFPIQNLSIAVSTGTGVGVNALLSMRLGQKNQKEVNLTAVNGLFLALCSYVIFLIFGIFGCRIYFESQTTDPAIIEYGVQYLSICMIASLGLFMSIAFDKLLQSTGLTFYTMISQLVGAITNIVLDPILIFGLCGFPKMGIAGAAVATVAGQFLGLGVSIFNNFTKNKEIHFQFRGFRPNSKVICEIYRVGVPSILLASIGSVMTYLMNLILGSFSMTAVAVFGVYFKLQSFIFMPLFGMNNAFVPIIAYNYGAQRKKRIMRCMKIGFLTAFSIMICGTTLFQIFPDVLLSLFKASEEMLFIGKKALRIISLHFPVAAFCIIFLSVFQALGQGIYSMFASFIRQLIVLLPAAYLLSLTGDVNNVWWAFPIAEIAALFASGLFMRHAYKKFLKNLPE